MAQPGYWPDDPYYYEPTCVECDDDGCPDCCELVPITLDDLDEIQWQMDQLTSPKLLPAKIYF